MEVINKINSLHPNSPKKSVKANSNNSTFNKVTNTSHNRTNTNRTNISNNSAVSFGERLYRKSLAEKDVKERKTNVMKSYQLEESKKNCSFKPSLNDSTLTLMKV